MPELKVAVVFINFGPYHFARAKALGETEGVSPFFIQLARSIVTHSWQVPDKYRSSIRLITLSELPFERCGYLELSRLLRKALDEIDPAVVVTASFRPFIMLSAARWAHFRNRRTVLFYETTPWDKRRRAPVETVKRWTLRQYYDAAFVGGSVHRDYLKELGMPEHRIWQPYDVVDNDYFAAKAALVRADPERWRKTLGLPDRYFLYVGRYAPEKNLLRLLEAYALYRESSAAGWSLVLVGDGPQRSELERYVSSTGLEGVFLKHFAQLENLPAYYALADCFVLPSTVDPWGLVVNEAMACGLPVIVSKLCGCVPELVQEGENGFHCDPYDTLAIAARLGRMASLDTISLQNMGDLSRKIISGFTPRIWANNLAQCVKVTAADNWRGTGS
jgi:glycosyltransferase involved in cell wall biosynthesis